MTNIRYDDYGGGDGGDRTVIAQSAEGRPGWMYGVRQYGMHTLLTYLTEVLWLVFLSHFYLFVKNFQYTPC